MNKYSGIDLHSNNCVVVVSDEDDRVCCERLVPNDLAKIVALLEPYRNDLVGVAVESTFNWYWLVDGLSAAGFDVKLVNTTAIAQYSGLKYSGDEYDARNTGSPRAPRPLPLLAGGFVLAGIFPRWIFQQPGRDTTRIRIDYDRIRARYEQDTADVNWR